MRREVIAGLCLLAGVASVRVLHAQGQFELTFREFKDSDPVASMSRVFCPPHEAAEEGLKLPSSGVSGKPALAAFPFDDKRVTLAVYTGKEPKLFVDADGDGDLAEEQAHAGSRHRSGGLFGGLFGGRRDLYRFRNVPVRAQSGAEARLSFEAHQMGQGQCYLMATPAGSMGGRVELGGKSYDVKVVDSNSNGRHDDAFAGTLPRACDWLTIDLDGNGRIKRATFGSTEAMPLPKMLRVADTYYSVGVTPDGTRIAMEAVQPRFGMLSMQPQGATVEVLSDSGVYSLKGSPTPRQLPAGDYLPVSVTLAAKDEQGAAWTLRGHWQEAESPFEISEGETLEWQVGPPLAVETEVHRSGRSASIGLNLVGQAGATYGAGAQRNRKPAPNPRLRITDESGEVLATGSFEFG